MERSRVHLSFVPAMNAGEFSQLPSPPGHRDADADVFQRRGIARRLRRRIRHSARSCEVDLQPVILAWLEGRAERSLSLRFGNPEAKARSIPKTEAFVWAAQRCLAASVTVTPWALMRAQRIRSGGGRRKTTPRHATGSRKTMKLARQF